MFGGVFFKFIFLFVCLINAKAVLSLSRAAIHWPMFSWHGLTCCDTQNRQRGQVGGDYSRLPGPAYLREQGHLRVKDWHRTESRCSWNLSTREAPERLWDICSSAQYPHSKEAPPHVHGELPVHQFSARCLLSSCRASPAPCGPAAPPPAEALGWGRPPRPGTGPHSAPSRSAPTPPPPRQSSTARARHVPRSPPNGRRRRRPAGFKRDAEPARPRPWSRGWWGPGRTAPPAWWVTPLPSPTPPPSPAASRPPASWCQPVLSGRVSAGQRPAGRSGRLSLLSR